MPRPQFTLRALLVAMLVVGLLLAWVARTRNIVCERRAFLREFSGRTSIVDDGSDTEPKELPWIRRMLGDEPVPALYDELAEPDREHVQQMRRLFPEAAISVRRKWYPPDGNLRRPAPQPDPLRIFYYPRITINNLERDGAVEEK